MYKIALVIRNSTIAPPRYSLQLFGGDSLIEIPGKFWGLGGVFGGDGEAIEVLGNEGANVAVEVATIGDDFLDGGKAVLPDLHRSLLTQPMFDKEKVATGF